MDKKKKTWSIVLGMVMIVVLFGAGYAEKMYMDVRNTAKSMHEKVDRKASTKRNGKVDIDAGEPFSVLLLGLDTGDMGRDEQGRSDTMMMVTVSPVTKQTTIISLARDTYTELVGLDAMDKLNHAYAYGGVEMAIASVEQLLDVPIDHYVTINMKGLKDLIESVGGVKIKNDIEFTQDSFEFNKGTIDLSGASALAYCRMRYVDPNGDYGRQERQRKVVVAIVEKALSISSVGNYKKILTTIEDNMKTDLTWEDMVDIQQKYRPTLKSIHQEQLQGEEVLREGISYQDIDPAELERLQKMIHVQLEKKK